MLLLIELTGHGHEGPGLQCPLKEVMCVQVQACHFHLPPGIWRQGHAQGSCGNVVPSWVAAVCPDETALGMTR